MPFKLTNLTGSNCNVPFNRDAERPTFVVQPYESVVITEAYLEAFDADTKDRFLRVTSGAHPVFKVEIVGAEPVGEPVVEPVGEPVGEVVVQRKKGRKAN